ncbi:MAG: 3-hydroxyacyl-ACP dehydratase FabZ [Chlamydiales bacterium]
MLLDCANILEILPHRYPILLVDRIIMMDLTAGTIVGQKNVTMNESFFQGHFPKAPIMPGVLILEALAQTGGILIYKKGYQQKTAVLLSINHAKFRKAVLPGDVLHLDVKSLHCNAKAGKIQGTALVNKTIVAEAEISFGLVDRHQFFKT